MSCGGLVEGIGRWFLLLLFFGDFKGRFSELHASLNFLRAEIRLAHGAVGMLVAFGGQILPGTCRCSRTRLPPGLPAD